MVDTTNIVNLIALEFGGQSVKAARVTSSGEIAEIFKFALPQDVPLQLSSDENGSDSFHKRLCSILRDARSDRTIAATGVAAPSPFDADVTFQLLQKPAYRHVNGNPLKPFIRIESDCNELYVLNDAAAAALGEIWKGRIKPAGRYLFLTLGTGLGGCFIVDGKIVKGEEYGATPSGEVWDYQFNGRNLEDSTGTTKSMVALYLSIRGLNLDVQHGDMRLLETFARYHGSKDYSKANYVFKKFGESLGLGIAGIAAKFQPEEIVLAGNLAKGNELFLCEANAAMARQFKLMDRPISPQFVVSDLIDKAGLLGAAYHALQQYSALHPHP